jgi:hypothetical protein
MINIIGELEIEDDTRYKGKTTTLTDTTWETETRAETTMEPTWPPTWATTKTPPVTTPYWYYETTARDGYWAIDNQGMTYWRTAAP